jgi:hypothetical protein
MYPEEKWLVERGVSGMHELLKRRENGEGAYC